MHRIYIAPKNGLVDESLDIQITGCPAGSPVSIRARIPSMKMSSQAVFKASDIGTVNLAKQAPISGSYDWVDPNGLIWTMVSEENRNSRPVFSLKPYEIHFTVSIEEQPDQTEVITRCWLADGVRREIVHEGNLRGIIFYPPAKGPHPAILMVSGSGGGIQETRAALFANHGYVVFTLGYFSYEDRPKRLQEIPLEYFEEAAHWLKSLPEVDPDKLVINGASRGGELSLLLGSIFPFFKAVVAYVPSSQVWSGTGDESEYLKPAWIYKGKPVLYYVPTARARHYSNPLPPKVIPIPLTPMFLESMEEEEYVKASTIPVENIKGAVLLISGEDDQMWPSTLFSNRVMERLEANGFPYACKHLHYPNTGHSIVGGYQPLSPNHSKHPVDGKDYAYGGQPQGQAFANQDSWKHILRFLENNL